MRFSYLIGDQGAASRTQHSNEVSAGFAGGQDSTMMDDLKVCFSKGFSPTLFNFPKVGTFSIELTKLKYKILCITHKLIYSLKDVEVAAGAVNSGGGMGSGGGLGGLVGGVGGMNRSGGVGGNLGPAGLQYSIPGILHFLQHEWARFEMERGQWEVEKAELQVCLLLGQ